MVDLKEQEKNYVNMSGEFQTQDSTWADSTWARGRKLVVIFVHNAHWDHENESSLGCSSSKGTGDWKGSCI